MTGDPKRAPLRFLLQLERLLEDEKANNVQRRANSLSFSGGVFRMAPTWNILAPIGSGMVQAAVEDQQLVVTYQLSFLQLVTASFALTAVFVFPLLSSQAFNVANALTAVGCWLFLVGVNIALTFYRFPRFISRAWEKAVEAYA
jgi:hypothetical protein